MKRTLLLLNILIGLASLWLIFQFNQVSPGGRYYQEINRLDQMKKYLGICSTAWAAS